MKLQLEGVMRDLIQVISKNSIQSTPVICKLNTIFEEVSPLLSSKLSPRPAIFSLRRLFFPLATFLIVCSATLGSAAGVLPPEEKLVLQEIGKTLGKVNWDFSVDPCSGERNWTTLNPIKGFENSVSCDCSYNDSTVCHVVSIVLKAQSLPGRLPPELVKLPFLREIDLTRNYLNGIIPREWGSMQLVNISILGNRISGEIPKELANINTLVDFVVEYNHLSGTIPPEFGNLPSIERILLTSNNLTGELPGTLANLATLKDFRIGDNQFVGSIPNFIQSWTNIEKLVIQGSGLNGPIPPGIASLTNLTDLRISDLKGNDSAFPPLSNAKNMRTLILRSCNIVGPLPEYLGLLTNLEILDLSFNKISGPIPKSLEGLRQTNYVYLSGNLLSGPVPDWMLNGRERNDLSFNNLKEASNCQPRNLLNLFASSSVGNTLRNVSCLRSSQCTQNLSSLHINCGGREKEADDDTIYEDDTDSGGPSTFFNSNKNWAFSSTGHFLEGEGSRRDSYILTNSSRISGINSQLYTDARLSPLSLTYYGFCLRNGNYRVNLHFAEILFTDDRTYKSLGRRLFNIYIQGKLEKEDFNIEDAAGGVNKPIVLPFTVEVSDNTLEIRFYWAGKGTNGIPDKGVYGPLISAISADSGYRHRNSLSAGRIVGIVLSVIFSISLILVLLWWKGCFRLKDTMEQDLMGLDLHTGSFALRQIKAATNNFDAANKIGEGGFGSVYKGNLSDGTTIAVKQLSSKSKQGNREFVNEIGMISALQHPNLVKLYGCCIEANQLLLVYEYLENNSLARALFGPKEHQLTLDWPTRRKISIGIARGLAYLHEESRLKIVHRDIKATNVLLDKDLNPKISDFGLAKLDEEENTHISTRIAGTYGYMAPEYAMRGYLTDKADVYSFGIVLLEIVSGKSNTSIKPKEECFYVLDWAHLLKEEGKLMELVDSRLESNFNKKEVMLALNLAFHCTNVSPTGRPSMSTVVSILEGKVVDKSLIISSDEEMPKESDSQRLLPKDNHQQQVQSLSIDMPWASSSESTSDLYPIGLDSHYLENRL